LPEPNANATLSPDRSVCRYNSVSRITTRLNRCADVLNRSDSSIAGAIKAGIADEPPPSVGEVARIERNMLMKQIAIHACHHEGGGDECDFRLERRKPSISA
jgi:hypothetical protein